MQTGTKLRLVTGLYALEKDKFKFPNTNNTNTKEQKNYGS